MKHLDALHAFYGEHMGVRIARKHLAWYCRARPGGEAFWRRVNRIESPAEQRDIASDFLLGRDFLAARDFERAA